MRVMPSFAHTSARWWLRKAAPLSTKSRFGTPRRMMATFNTGKKAAVFSLSAKAAYGTTRVASSMKAMRYVFLFCRPATSTAGPCITSLIHSSPAFSKAKRRLSPTNSPDDSSGRV